MGPGMIVARSKNETIRSHTDLQKNNAPHFKVRYTDTLHALAGEGKHGVVHCMYHDEIAV